MTENEKIPMGQEGISKEIAENEKNLLENLQRRASYFLNEVAQAVKKLQAVNEGFDDKKVQKIYTAARDSLEMARNITSKQYDFEAALNEFLGRKINLIWVDENGNIFYIAQENAKEFYIQGSRKGEGRLGIEKSKMISNSDTAKDLKKDFDEYLKSFEKRSNFLIGRKQLYKGVKDKVIERWEGNHNPQTEKQKKWYNIKENDSYPYRNTFWWEFNKGYDHSKKMNRGNIYEAYISIIFDKDKNLKPFWLSDTETNVRLYWEYMQSRNILNNIPGIVEGDVVFDNIHQYAVKAGSFNTASLGPYIVAAVEILKLELCDPETIELEVLKTINPKSFQAKIKEKGFQKFVAEAEKITNRYK